MQNKKEFDIAKDLFIRYGDCKHKPKWFYEVRPYKCNLTQTCCGICNKQISRVYDEWVVKNILLISPKELELEM